MDPLPADVSGSGPEPDGPRCPGCDNRTPADAEECGACGQGLDREEG